MLSVNPIRSIFEVIGVHVLRDEGSCTVGYNAAISDALLLTVSGLDVQPPSYRCHRGPKPFLVWYTWDPRDADL